jgi:hypothetical protein
MRPRVSNTTNATPRTTATATTTTTNQTNGNLPTISDSNNNKPPRRFNTRIWLGIALLLMAGFRFYTVLIPETKHTEFVSAEKRHENSRNFDPMKYPTLGAMPLVVVWNSVVEEAKVVIDTAASQNQYVLVVPFDLSLDNVADIAERSNAVIATFEVIQRKDFDSNSAQIMGLARASTMIPSACFLLIDLTSPLWSTDTSVYSLKRLECDQPASFGPAPKGGLPFLLLPEKRRAIETHRALIKWTEDWSKCIKRTFYNSPTVPNATVCAEKAKTFVTNTFPNSGKYTDAIDSFECKFNVALCDRIFKMLASENNKKAFAESNEWLFERKG